MFYLHCKIRFFFDKSLFVLNFYSVNVFSPKLFLIFLFMHVDMSTTFHDSGVLL